MLKPSYKYSFSFELGPIIITIIDMQAWTVFNTGIANLYTPVTKTGLGVGDKGKTWPTDLRVVGAS